MSVAPERVAWEQELASVDATLTLSREVVSHLWAPYNVVGQSRVGLTGAPTIHWWFAKIYEIVTQRELDVLRECASKPSSAPLRYPSFTARFVPIFYDLYYQSVPAKLYGKAARPTPYWEAYWELAERAELASGIQAIAATVEAGVRAHIEGDLPEALLDAYAQYVAHTGSLPFASLRADFLGPAQLNTFPGAAADFQRLVANTFDVPGLLPNQVVILLQASRAVSGILTDSDVTEMRNKAFQAAYQRTL